MLAQLNLIRQIYWLFYKHISLSSSDPTLFVYCCDFSSNAINLVKVSQRFRFSCVLLLWYLLFSCINSAKLPLNTTLVSLSTSNKSDSLCSKCSARITAVHVALRTHLCHMQTRLFYSSQVVSCGCFMITHSSGDFIVIK